MVVTASMIHLAHAQETRPVGRAMRERHTGSWLSDQRFLLSVVVCCCFATLPNRRVMRLARLLFCCCLASCCWNWPSCGWGHGKGHLLSLPPLLLLLGPPGCGSLGLDKACSVQRIGALGWGGVRGWSGVGVMPGHATVVLGHLLAGEAYTHRGLIPLTIPPLARSSLAPHPTWVGWVAPLPLPPTPVPLPPAPHSVLKAPK